MRKVVIAPWNKTVAKRLLNRNRANFMNMSLNKCHIVKFCSYFIYLFIIFVKLFEICFSNMYLLRD